MMNSPLGFNPASASRRLPDPDSLPQRWRNLPYVFGGGRTSNATMALVFMNPTARNQSVIGSWQVGRSPFIGLSRIWRFLVQCGLLDEEDLNDLPTDGAWSETYAEVFYSRIANRGLYVTNLVKATGADATNPPRSLAKAFRAATIAELEEVNPEVVVTMGTLVSSVMLEREIRFRDWFEDGTSGPKYETNAVGKADVVPCYYPIGRGNPKGAQQVLRALASEG